MTLRTLSRPTVSRINALKRKFISFYNDPSQFIDFTTPMQAYDCYGDTIEGAFTYKAKTFAEILGIEKLGAGAFGEVYTLADGFVLKIETREDSGYRRFVDVVMANPNPHFPRILYSGTWAGKRVYILERLTPTTRDDEDKWDRTNERVDLSEHFRNAMQRYRRASGNPYFGGYATPELEEAARILYEHQLTGDLHGDNMMWRGDVPVVTDPCAGW